LLRHTVEELQKFGLTRTPSPPWVLTHRVLVPINPCCSDAAEYIIKALGGPETAFKLCGGTKWWTVRFQAGVEGEWIGIKKDWRKEEERVRKEEEARKKGSKMSKGKEKLKESVSGSVENTDKEKDGIEGECMFNDRALSLESGTNVCNTVTPEMDHLRCMMYLPGASLVAGKSLELVLTSIIGQAGRIIGDQVRTSDQRTPIRMSVLMILSSQTVNTHRLAPGWYMKLYLSAF
jgi:hypothetical protein